MTARQDGVALDAALALSMYERRFGDAVMLVRQGANPNTMVASCYLDGWADGLGRGPERGSEPALVVALRETGVVTRGDGASAGAGRPTLSGGGLGPGLVQALLDAGAKVDAKSADGEAALDIAVAVGDVHSIEVLLRHGADTNARDKGGRTTLMHHASDCSADVARTLLRGGAIADSRDPDGRTALAYAAEAGNTPLATALLDFRANIDSSDSFGRTPLMSAVRGSGDDGAMSGLLLEHGASVDARDNDGETALMYAAGRRVEDVRALLKHGADLEAADQEGWTALSIASAPAHESGLPACPEIVGLLKRYAATRRYQETGRSAR